jgi:hypothetical protein
MVDAFNYILIVNDDETTFDLGQYIDKNSVKMSIAPRVSRIITTIDGREHISGFGYRQTLTFKFNPLTRGQAVDVVSRMIQAAAFKVEYRSLMPPDTMETSFDMRLSQMSAEYLSRCKFGGANFYQFDEIQLVQL